MIRFYSTSFPFALICGSGGLLSCEPSSPFSILSAHHSKNSYFPRVRMRSSSISTWAELLIFFSFLLARQRCARRTQTQTELFAACTQITPHPIPHHDQSSCPQRGGGARRITLPLVPTTEIFINRGREKDNKIGTYHRLQPHSAAR